MTGEGDIHRLGGGSQRKSQSAAEPGNSAANRCSPSFLLDGMLGSLARWLRLLGYDTIYLRNPPDGELLSTARNQHRILLTRDRSLLEQARRLGITALNPGPAPVRGMLFRLHKQLGINLNPDPNCSRCPHCNAPLTPATPDQVKGLIPPGSLQHHSRFWQCTNPDCRHVYWQGSHWRRIRQTLQLPEEEQGDT